MGQAVAQAERTREQHARQNSILLAEARARKNTRATFLRRLKRGFTPNGRSSRELTEARWERRRLKRGANAERLAAVDARIAAALVDARAEFDEAKDGYQSSRFPMSSTAFATSNPDAAARLRTLHQRFKVHCRARSRSSDGLARSAEIAEILRDAWALVDALADKGEHA